MSLNSSKIEIEVHATGPGDCIFNSVNAAANYFGKKQLSESDRARFQSTRKSAALDWQRAIGKTDDFGGSLLISANIITRGLGEIGLRASRLLVAPGTLTELAGQNYLDKSLIPIEDIVRVNSGNLWFPSIVFKQNTINPNFSHVFFCQSATEFKKLAGIEYNPTFDNIIGCLTFKKTK